ncbi:MAG: YcxB family protein [Lachnospiraceae bacterium]|nr:YcxB family protein [Lachnospiraceae bacterium]
MTFEVKVRTKELFGFTMYHAYSGVMGKIWLIFSVFCLGAAVFTFGDVSIQGTGALIFLGALFTVINPAMLYWKCVKRVSKTPSYQKPFCYILTKKGFSVSQGEEIGKVRWDELFQIVCRKKAVYLCLDPLHAQIISLEQLGEQAEELKEFLRTQVSREVRKSGL